MKSVNHPQLDKKLVLMFDEAAHEYRIESGNGYEYADPVPSVTQFVGHYMPKFDSDKVAAKCATRRNVEKETILDEWHQAADFGTRVHENQEAMMRGKNIVHQPRNEHEEKIMSSGWQALNVIGQHGWVPIEAEKMVFSHVLGIAGTIDALFTRGRELMLCDWKTNKSINRKNLYGDRALPPIGHLDDCEMTKYALQLNLYERILKYEAYIPKAQATRMNLVHLRPDGFEIIPVPKMVEADILLLDYKCFDWFHTVPF